VFNQLAKFGDNLLNDIQLSDNTLELNMPFNLTAEVSFK
jgi:hypothetical protein